MKGTTPPWEMTTSPRSLFNLSQCQRGLPTQKRSRLLLVVTDGQLQVARDNTLLLVVTRSITRKLENLGGKVLKDSSQVDYARQGLRPLSATWPDCTYSR